MNRAYSFLTGLEVQVGDTVTDFRGETAELVTIDRPQDQGRDGKVSVRWHHRKQGALQQYYAGVFDLEILGGSR